MRTAAAPRRRPLVPPLRRAEPGIEDPTVMTDALNTNLPPLDEPCTYCTGPAADAERRANAEDWRAWDADEEDAYAKWATGRSENYSYGAWERSDTYRALHDRQPESMAGTGCVECNWTSSRPTSAGRQILD